MLQIGIFLPLSQIWLGIVNLLQTFEELDSIKDKHADTQTTRQLFDEDDN